LQNGQTALCIAQKLGYISVVETLKVVTDQVSRVFSFWWAGQKGGGGGQERQERQENRKREHRTKKDNGTGNIRKRTKEMIMNREIKTEKDRTGKTEKALTCSDRRQMTGFAVIRRQMTILQ
jgi:hypothetical protein